MAVGFMQLAVDSFATPGGVPFNQTRFCTRTLRKFTLPQDRDEIAENLAAAIYTRVLSILPNTIIKHRFAYRLLPSCNLLIALDPREFDHEPFCNDTIGEDTGCF